MKVDDLVEEAGEFGERANHDLQSTACRNQLTIPNTAI